MKTTKLNEHHKLLTFKDKMALEQYLIKNLLCISYK